MDETFFEKLRDHKDVSYFRDRGETESILYAIHKNILIGTSSLERGMAHFYLDTKNGINGSVYELNDFGIRPEPLKNEIVLNNIRGRDVLSNLIDLQLRSGAKYLMGDWSSGDNLETFNKHIASGSTLEDAIENTFTAKVFKDFGFENFVISNTEHNDNGYGLIESVFYQMPQHDEVISRENNHFLP